MKSFVHALFHHARRVLILCIPYGHQYWKPTKVGFNADCIAKIIEESNSSESATSMEHVIF